MLGRDDDDDDDGDGGEHRDRRIGERRRARRVRPPLASCGTARVASEALAGASRAGSVAVRRGGSRVQGRGRTRGGIRRDQEAQDIQRQRRYATARRRATRPPRRFARKSTPARIASPERLAPGSTLASASRRGSRARSRPHSPRRIAAMRDRDADRVRTRRARPDRDPPRGDVRVRTLRFKLPNDRRGGHSSFLPRPVHLVPSVDPLARIPALTSPSLSPSPSHRSQCTSCTTCPLCAVSSRTTWNRGRNFCAPSTATSSPRRCCRRWTWARRRCPP